MPEDARKFAEKIGVVAHNSTVNIHNQNIGVSDDSGASPINWREVCQNKFQQQLDVNRQRRLATGRGFELDIYVPLGLVERKQQPRRSEDISPEKGMVAYQLTEEVIKTTYEHEKFLTEVIGDDFNTKGKNIAIIGEPGAGKSTLLEKIGKYLIEHNALPIYIPLSNLSGDTLKEYLLNRWLENPITPNQLQELLQQQRVWFLLDGLDEMQAASSVDALNKISQDISKLAAARVVLTCRLNVWDASTKNLLDFQNFKTQEFSSEQVQDFILAWFQRAKQEESEVCHSERNDSGAKNLKNPSFPKTSIIQQGEQLWQKLNESGRERLLDLVKNPLRLALMCQAWDTTKDLPETQAALYKRFTLYHYEWKQAEFPTTLAEQNELNAALGKLAREAIASGKTRFRIGQNFAYRVMGENLFNRGCRLGWLNQVDRDKQTDEPFYAFYHATFQEYFAALAIDDWHFLLNHVPNNPFQGTYRIFEPQWKQVILLWLGCQEVKTEPKEQFIKALVEFEDNCNNFYKYRAYFLAATGIAEFGDCSKADEIVKQIVKWGFYPSIADNLIGPIESIAAKWDVETSLINKLLDSTENIGNIITNFSLQQAGDLIELLITRFLPQEAAEVVLAQTYRPKVINALVDLIGNSKDDYTRWRAADILGKIDPGNTDAIRALVDLTRNSKHYSTRWGAAESLGEIDPGNTDAIRALVDLTRNSKHYSTRWGAAESLGKIGTGNTDAIRALVDLIGNSKHDDTRWEAAESLGKIGAGNTDAIRALVDLIGNSKHDSTRWEAAESLGKIGTGNTDAIRALVDLIGNSKDDDTRRLAADILGKIGTGNTDAIRALVDLIGNSKDDDTRRLAADILGKIGTGNTDAIRALVDLTRNSKDDDTRRLAADILGKIGTGNTDAIRALVDLTRNSKDDYTRWGAAESLGEIDPGNTDAIRAFVDLTRNSKDDDTRWRAAESLGKIGAGNTDAIRALVDLTRNSKHDSTRWRAAERLGKIGAGNTDAIRALVDLTCNSKDDDTRRLAADILGKIGTGNTDAIRALVDLTRNSKDDDTRRLAADILGKIGTGNTDAIRALVDLTRNSKDDDTRRLAADILGKIDPGNTDAIRALVDLTRNSKHDSTRWLAADILGKIDPGNTDAIRALVDLTRNSKHDSTRWRAAERLGEIDPGNTDAIRALVDLTCNSKDDHTRRLAADILGKIGTGNTDAIRALVDLIGNSKHDSTRWRAAESLGKIGAGNTDAIRALVDLIGNSKHDSTRWRAADILGKIGAGNTDAIRALVDLMGNSKDNDTRSLAADSLKDILTVDQMAEVVTTLKYYLSPLGIAMSIVKFKISRYFDFYQVLWDYAQNMPYPDFYQAWHHRKNK